MVSQSGLLEKHMSALLLRILTVLVLEVYGEIDCVLLSVSAARVTAVAGRRLTIVTMLCVGLDWESQLG